MPIPRLVMNVSFPLMVSLLVQSLYNIVDGMYVARISEQALAATSLAYPIQLLMVAVSVGTGVGINSLISRKIGARKYEEVGITATTGLLLSAVSSLIFVLAGFILSRPFFSMYTEDRELITLGMQYLSICTSWSLGLFLASMSERLLQSTGNTVMSMVAQISGALTNVILDPILIFGFFGLPAMGIRGAAIATVIGQWVSAIIALLLILKEKEIHFTFRHFRLNGRTVWDIYKVGCPSMFVQAMGSVMMMGVNNVLVGFSAASVSFFGIYFKLQNFAFMPACGIAQGLIPIVGYNYGARHGKRIWDSVKIASLLSFIIMGIGTLLFLLMPRQLLLMYNANEEMLALGIPALRILSLVLIPTAFILVIGYMFTGLGNGMINMVSTILRMILPIPMVYLFARFMGLPSVWHAFWISILISAVYCLAVTKKVYHTQLKPMMESERE